MIKSIILTGVGGQGILLAARVIASAAEFAGYQVCTNEIHGMAQRGGSVTAQVRFGDTVCSPLALEGTADVLYALEHIEAIRFAHFLRADGLAAVSKQSIVPTTVTNGECTYPADVDARLKKLFRNLIYLDCQQIAASLGNIKLANTILTGAASTALPELSEEAWRFGLERSVKPEFLEINLKAFETGRTAK